MNTNPTSRTAQSLRSAQRAFWTTAASGWHCPSGCHRCLDGGTIIVQPGTTNTIYNVPVDYTYDSSAYTSRA